MTYSLERYRDEFTSVSLGEKTTQISREGCVGLASLVGLKKLRTAFAGNRVAYACDRRAKATRSLRTCEDNSLAIATVVDEIAEPRPDMNIKVAAFTVSEKSSNTSTYMLPSVNTPKHG